MNKLLSKILAYLGYSQYSVLYGYLKRIGWFYSAKHQISVDQKLDHIPWYSYAFIHFINDKHFNQCSILEFGSGSSTLWWSQRCLQIFSIEHDIKYFESFKDKMPSNVTYKLLTLDDYYQVIKTFSNKFDVIIIDGIQRNECAKHSLQALKPDGIIIFDNSDREQYKESIQFFNSNDFKQLKFYSLGPINGHPWETSIFYKDSNCLGI